MICRFHLEVLIDECLLCERSELDRQIYQLSTDLEKARKEVALVSTGAERCRKAEADLAAARKEIESLKQECEDYEAVVHDKDLQIVRLRNAPEAVEALERSRRELAERRRYHKANGDSHAAKQVDVSVKAIDRALSAIQGERPVEPEGGGE